MISFIIIGKNEGARFIRCLHSIEKVLSVTHLKDYEIVYVDSKSEDNSIAEAQKMDHVRIFLISGTCNAAIARNIGGQEAKGDILYFIDGDLELNENFLLNILNDKEELNYPFISGIVTDYNYDDDWNFTSKEKRHLNTKDSYQLVVGGVFIVTKKRWDKLKGLKTKLKVNEDLDFGMRMAENGCPLLLKALPMVNHHTHPYHSEASVKNFTFREAKYNAVLLRNHITHFKILLYILRMRLTFMQLCLSITLSLLTPWALLLYPILLIKPSYKAHKLYKINAFKDFYYTIIGDLFFIINIFTFFPKEIKLEYKEIKDQ